MSNNEKGNKIFKVKSPTKEDLKWIEYYDNLIFETPKRLEETAKFLSGMISISLTILLIGDKNILTTIDDKILKLVAIFWLLSLLFVFIVIFQRKNTFINKSPDSIKIIHNKIIRFKYLMLIVACAFYFLALLILSWVILA